MERYWQRKAYVCDVGESRDLGNQKVSSHETTEPTYHFDILQCETCASLRIGLRVDVRHVAPILYLITSIAGRNVSIAESKSKHIGAIDDGFEVVDLRSVWWIPRAVQA